MIVAVQIGLSIFGTAFDSWFLIMTWNIFTKAVGFILAMGLIRASLSVCGIGLLLTYPLTAVTYAWGTLSGGAVAQLA